VENVKYSVNVLHVVVKVFGVLLFSDTQILSNLLVGVVNSNEITVLVWRDLAFLLHFVGMVLLGESQIGLFDFLLRTSRLDSQHLIVALAVHGCGTYCFHLIIYTLSRFPHSRIVRKEQNVSADLGALPMLSWGYE
jgi:hypothetical protein